MARNRWFSLVSRVQTAVSVKIKPNNSPGRERSQVVYLENLIRKIGNVTCKRLDILEQQKRIVFCLNRLIENPMATVSESIPEALRPRVDAAVAWFNKTDDAAGDEFKATGILNPDDALINDEKLHLVICGGDRCEQYSFWVRGGSDNWDIGLLDQNLSSISHSAQAELDPPPGARLSWLDRVLAQHEFVLLLFYRGFW